MIDVRVPDEQEGTKAVVRAWLRKVGDTVAVNDPLVELETDKVTQEVPSPVAGVLREIMLDTDAEAVPGTLLGRIEVGTDAPVTDKPIERPVIAPGFDKSSLSSLAEAGENRLSPSVKRALLQHGICLLYTSLTLPTTERV